MTADDRRLADPAEKACLEWWVAKEAFSCDDLIAFVREQRLEAAMEAYGSIAVCDPYEDIIGYAENRYKALRAEREAGEGKG